MPENEFKPVITLADDSKLNGSAGLNERQGELWIWLHDEMDMLAACRTFCDSSRTIRIQAEIAPEVCQEFEGYTRLVLIREDDGKISVRMKRGVTDGE